MPEVQFRTLYRYAALTQVLQAYAAEYPGLVRLASLGQSHEGRDIWVVTVTNFASGEDVDKPALWVDGNIHATEIAPSSACLYLINYLVTGYGSDPDITHCLDTRSFYVCPRVSPDGAEWALADRPRMVRSSTRAYPHEDEIVDGLVEEDIDGDGRLLSMRIPDPHGPWKVWAEEPRLLAPRDPTERGGQYYRLLPEGRIEGYDGFRIKVPPTRQGLDMNRNFPPNWRPEGVQPGAGPYPISEPETRALAQFVVAHRNITGSTTFHTYAGAFIRPYSSRPDDALPLEDVRVYEKLGAKATEITGYPAVSIYHGFRSNPREIATGSKNEWFYDHLGVFSWGVEIWSPQRQAGIKGHSLAGWSCEHPPADDLAMLRWSDEALGGAGYVDWYPYDHPQLGPIHLGGWDRLHAFNNPPPAFLEKEIALFPRWLVWFLLISPRLELLHAQALPMGDGLYRVRLAVQNSGWLPTYVTKQALAGKMVPGITARIGLPEGATLVSGRPQVELGQLEGRSYQPSSHTGLRVADATSDRAQAEWVIHAPHGGKIELAACHERAGKVTAELSLS